MPAVSVSIVSLCLGSALNTSPIAPPPTFPEQATRVAETFIDGTEVMHESSLTLHGLGEVSTVLQMDLGGAWRYEVYLGDRLVRGMEADFRDGAIAYDEYVDLDGLSSFQILRIVGASVHEVVHAFDEITFGGTAAQATDWCKVGCGAAAGAAGSLAGGLVFAGCTAVFKVPGICKTVAGAIAGAVVVGVKEACEQVFCGDG